jgi:Ca2+-binding EF-hand superfamily protein
MQFFYSQYSEGRVMMKNGWTRLDVDQDGFISFGDLYQSSKKLYSYVSSLELYQHMNEIKNDMY